MSAAIVSVGVDEAGYGPKLGPLVVTATSVDRPADEADLYGILAPAVVRSPRAHRSPNGRTTGRKDPCAGALYVADSKKVYSPASAARRGLAELERSVLAFLEAAFAPAARPATDLAVVRTLSTSPPDLGGLAWYGGKAEPLPVEADPRDVRGAAAGLMAALEAGGCGVPAFRTRVVTAREFNAAIGRGLNKADLLVGIVADLLAASCAAGRTCGNGPEVSVLVDHLGGRKDYAGLLARAFPAAEVREESISPVESRYSVGPGCSVAFACKAESRCMTVALSSMVSKYVRELMMRRLNRYFTARVPGLKPTAGYPVDAARFLADTQDFRAESGIPDEILVRTR